MLSSEMCSLMLGYIFICVDVEIKIFMLQISIWII